MTTPSDENVRVSNIWQQNDRTLGIEWTDGKKSLFDVVELRRACRCAVCVDEWTSAKILDPKKVSEQVRPKNIESVGRYALKIDFTDGHSTGIYTFNYLRQLGN
ncbi:MAG: DUF971 domain-containing protein [Oligoflexales bacterium]